MSKDIVFDEMASWYSVVKDDSGADVHEIVVPGNTGQQSQVFSGPPASLSVTSI